MPSYQQVKDIEAALGPQQAAPIIAALEELDRKIDRQQMALKEDLLLELATKADIANVRTEIADLRTELKEDIANLRLEIKTDITRLDGELKSIRLWMKLLVAIGILGMTFFSPTTIKLLEMLK